MRYLQRKMIFLEPEEPEHDAYEFVDETEEQRVNDARHNENGHFSGEMSSNPNGQLSAQRDNDNDSENCDLDFYTEVGSMKMTN